MILLDLNFEAWKKKPYSGVSVLRAKFDEWLASKAEEAGVAVLSGILIDDNEKMYKRIQEVEGLKSDGYFEMGEWCCMKLAKI